MNFKTEREKSQKNEPTIARKNVNILKQKNNTQKKVLFIKNDFNILINMNFYKNQENYQTQKIFNNIKIVLHNPQTFQKNILVKSEFRIEKEKEIAYKLFLKDKQNFKIEKDDFFFLKKFFYSLFYDGIFNDEYFENFTFLARLVMSKFVDGNEFGQDNYLNKELLKKKITEKFLCEEKKRRGFKITNAKRFIFRKVKNILFKKFKKEKEDISDYKILEYYFKNGEVPFEKRDFLNFKRWLNNYKKNEIVEILKYENFVRDFLKILDNFIDEMRVYYYKAKIQDIFFHLDNLTLRKILKINEIYLPWSKIPYSHRSLIKFKGDFEKSFSNFLKHY